MTGSSQSGSGLGVRTASDIMASPVVIGALVVIVGGVAAVAPALVVPLAFAIAVTVGYVMYPLGALAALVAWLVLQPGVSAALDAHGLSDLATWIRRADEPVLVLAAVVGVLDGMLREGRIRLFGLGRPVLALLTVVVLSAIWAGHAPLVVVAVDVVLM